MISEGARVRLKPDEQEGWAEEYGTVLGRSGVHVWIVEVEPTEAGDDGLREVTEEQIELLP